MNNEDRLRVAKTARGWLGTPYCHQASVRKVGCDCLGLVRGVWRELYGHEPEVAPPYTADWAEALGSETLRDAARRSMVEIEPKCARPGDVVLFRWRTCLPAKHVAVIATEDTFIHACEGIAVSEVPFSKWWRRHAAYAFEFPPINKDI